MKTQMEIFIINFRGFSSAALNPNQHSKEGELLLVLPLFQPLGTTHKHELSGRTWRPPPQARVVSWGYFCALSSIIKATIKTSRNNFFYIFLKANIKTIFRNTNNDV